MSGLPQELLESRRDAPGTLNPLVGDRTLANGTFSNGTFWRGAGLAKQRFALARTIEAEVIPHLLKLRESGALVPAIGENEIKAFSERLLERDGGAADETIERLRTRPVSVEAIFLDLLAPAARELGTKWDEDLCSFQDVTLGLGRLQRLMHGLGQTFRPAAGESPHARRVLMMPAPGEQHTFGISMVAEFFRRGGWSVRSGPRTSAGDLAATVRGAFYDVVGISVGNEKRFDAVAAAIRVMRRVALNPKLGIMVGGPAFIEHPEAVAAVGADATAIDGREAVARANVLLARARAIV